MVKSRINGGKGGGGNGPDGSSTRKTGVLNEGLPGLRGLARTLLANTVTAEKRKGEVNGRDGRGGSGTRSVIEDGPWKQMRT